MARVTQKEFIEAARKLGDTVNFCGVTYEYPGFFQVEDKKIKIETHRISCFLTKLSTVMLFNHYDIFARAVWVDHLKNAKDPYARTYPELTGNKPKPANNNPLKPL